MHKRSFTLMEMLLVIIILGALSGLALPRFMKFMEIQRAQSAINQIRLIVAAKDYFVQNRIPCPAECAGGCATDIINDKFGLDIRDQNFNHQFTCQPADGMISSWSVDAIRTPDPSFGAYTFEIDDASSGIINCIGSTGCNFTGMTNIPL